MGPLRNKSYHAELQQAGTAGVFAQVSVPCLRTSPIYCHKKWYPRCAKLSVITLIYLKGQLGVHSIVRAHGLSRSSITTAERAEL